MVKVDNSYLTVDFEVLYKSLGIETRDAKDAETYHFTYSGTEAQLKLSFTYTPGKSGGSDRYADVTAHIGNNTDTGNIYIISTNNNIANHEQSYSGQYKTIDNGETFYVHFASQDRTYGYMSSSPTFNSINFYLHKTKLYKYETMKKILVYNTKNIGEKLTGVIFGMLPTGEWRDGN